MSSVLLELLPLPVPHPYFFFLSLPTSNCLFLLPTHLHCFILSCFTLLIITTFSSLPSVLYPHVIFPLIFRLLLFLTIICFLAHLNITACHSEFNLIYHKFTSFSPPSILLCSLSPPPLLHILFPSASLYHNCLLSQYPCPYYQFLYKSTFSAQTTMFKVSIVNYLFKSQIVLPKFVFRFQVSPLKRSFLNPEIPFYTQKL